jgi:hypothetical protein
MVNSKGKSLLMDINPNLDEIIAEENTVADTEKGEEHIKLEKEEVAEHNEVFAERSVKPTSKKPVFKKPSMSREDKARIREEEKQKKEEERARRREETAQRNREKARLRYYDQKAIKEQQQKVEKNIPKKIVEQTEEKLNNFQKQEVSQKVSSNMDFHTFATYMLKYDELKEQVARQQREKMPPPKPVEKPKPKYHPDNYPISAVYRNKRSMPNNFF